jgi:hypothetical protein
LPFGKSPVFTPPGRRVKSVHHQREKEKGDKFLAIYLLIAITTLSTASKERSVQYVQQLNVDYNEGAATAPLYIYTKLYRYYFN